MLREEIIKLNGNVNNLELSENNYRLAYADIKKQLVQTMDLQMSLQDAIQEREAEILRRAQELVFK